MGNQSATLKKRRELLYGEDNTLSTSFSTERSSSSIIITDENDRRKSNNVSHPSVTTNEQEDEEEEKKEKRRSVHVPIHNTSHHDDVLQVHTRTVLSPQQRVKSSPKTPKSPTSRTTNRLSLQAPKTSPKSPHRHHITSPTSSIRSHKTNSLRIISSKSIHKSNSAPEQVMDEDPARDGVTTAAVVKGSPPNLGSSPSRKKLHTAPTMSPSAKIRNSLAMMRVRSLSDADQDLASTPSTSSSTSSNHSPIFNTAHASINSQEVVTLLKDPIGLQLFYDFCSQEFSTENIDLFKELEYIEVHLQSLSSTRRSKHIKTIHEKYLREDSGTEVNVSHTSRKMVEKERHSKRVDVETAKNLLSFLKRDVCTNLFDSFSRFIQTKEYKQWREMKSSPANSLNNTPPSSSYEDLEEHLATTTITVSEDGHGLDEVVLVGSVQSSVKELSLAEEEDFK